MTAVTMTVKRKKTRRKAKLLIRWTELHKSIKLWSVATKYKMRKEDQTLKVLFTLETTTSQIMLRAKMVEGQGEDALRMRGKKDVVKGKTGTTKAVMVGIEIGDEEQDSKVMQEVMMAIVQKIAIRIVGREGDSREGRKERKRGGKIEGKMEGKMEGRREKRKVRMPSLAK